MLHLKPRKFTVAEYARMGDSGVIPADERVELIEGVVLPLSPQNRRHASRTARITTIFVTAFGSTHEIRVQLPLTLGEYSEPEPDFALVSFEVADAAVRHPGSADLVLEISDTSLAFDRQEKASLYAMAGIQDYWLLNLRHRRLEVRRGPAPNSEAAFGWEYSSVTIYAEGQSLSPLFAPNVIFEVSALLGPSEKVQSD